MGRNFHAKLFFSESKTSQLALEASEKSTYLDFYSIKHTISDSRKAGIPYDQIMKNIQEQDDQKVAQKVNTTFEKYNFFWKENDPTTQHHTNILLRNTPQE